MANKKFNLYVEDGCDLKSFWRAFERQRTIQNFKCYANQIFPRTQIKYLWIKE